MSTIRTVAILCALIFTVIASSSVYSCTTFVLQQGESLVFGRNLDWCTGTGLLIVNQRDLAKTAILAPPEKPLDWVSKYGSVTFNQVGRELPYGGINEAGLIVEHMSLDVTEYPPEDDRLAIQACQWTQFQLDNYSTVDEVIRSDQLLRISDDFSKFHFLVSDKAGNAAVIEFLNGKMVHYSGEDLPIPVLANSTYEESMGHYNTDKDVLSNRSLCNFVTAAKMVSERDQETEGSLIDYAFKILSTVSQGPGTKWSVAYDMTEMRVHFKVFETPKLVGERKVFLKGSGVAKLKYIDIEDFDFDCAKPARIVDLELEKEGCNNPYFVEYTTEINRSSIAQAFTFFKKWGVPIQLTEEELTGLSEYPETFECVNGN